LFCVSSVCAEETNTLNSINDMTDLNNNDVEQIPTNNINSEDSFYKLQQLIDSNSTINLDNDFQMYDESPINISKDLTINGNGYDIIGNGKNRIINIYSGNIILNNVNFIGGSCLYHSNNKCGTIEPLLYNGGAIHIKAGNLTINNCLFEGNSAHVGGAIYSSNQFNDIIINNCVFKNNFAQRDAGALFSLGNTDIKNSIFQNNTAIDGDGGALFLGSYKVNTYTISNSQFLTNHANNGGAIYGNTLNIVKSRFMGNTATAKYYTVVRSDLPDRIEGKVAYHLTNATLEGIHYLRLDNPTIKGGGAICSGVGTVTIEDTKYENNHADDYGGAIYTNNIIFKGQNNFYQNTANYGGAVYTATITEDVKRATFRFNTAKKDGGAIYIGDGVYGGLKFNPKSPIGISISKTYCTFTFCIFENNKADQRGGAIMINSRLSKINLTKNMLVDNDAPMGKCAYTYRTGGIVGDPFDLGPNYYGNTADCIKNQFYYAKLIPDPKMDLFIPCSGDEQRVKTWFKDTIDIYDDKVEGSNSVTFEDIEARVNQVLEIYSGVPVVGHVAKIISQTFKIIHWFKD
jgi:predicted outer membrane repeat protein